MRRTLWGTTALVVGALIVIGGPPAGAQEVPNPRYAGVTVTPAQVSGPNDVITVRGPAFNGVGCRFGTVLAVPGTGRANAVRLEAGADLNTPDPNSPDNKWTVVTKAGAVPLGTGSYTIYLDCTEGQTTTYITDAVFSVTASATTITTVATTTTSTTSTTTPGGTTPSGTTGTVDPSTVKPGVDTITIRGGGFKASAPLQITLATTPVTAVGTTTATATGAYAATLKLPASAPPGNQQLVVTGPGPDDVSRSTTASLTVQDLNCSDFASPAAAQAALGPGGADPHGLDADKDGRACQTVRARSATGSGATSAKATSGALPATGIEHTSYELVVGLASMTLGALLVGLSHPAPAPAGAAGGHRRRRRGSHFR